MTSQIKSQVTINNNHLEKMLSKLFSLEGILETSDSSTTPKFLRTIFYQFEKKIEIMGEQMASIIKARDAHFEETQSTEIQHLYYLFFNNPQQLLLLIEDYISKIQTRKIK